MSQFGKEYKQGYRYVVFTNSSLAQIVVSLHKSEIAAVNKVCQAWGDYWLRSINESGDSCAYAQASSLPELDAHRKFLNRQARNQ